jgi:transcriptional regulator with XRE-family HTH domain
MNQDKLIPHALVLWRKEKGLNQEQFAERSGLDQSRVSRFENARIARLTPEQARQVEAATEGAVTMSDCLFRTPRVIADELKIPYEAEKRKKRPAKKSKSKKTKKRGAGANEARAAAGGAR